MTGLRRVVAANVPHHLTQRGNARQFILHRDEDRAVYLKLLRGPSGGPSGTGPSGTDGTFTFAFLHLEI